MLSLAFPRLMPPPLPSALLETLEPRIAPAVILVGGDPTSSQYDDAPFIKASLSPDPSVQSLFNGSNDHYYLNLAARDVVKFYDNADGYKNFISVNASRVFAFFFDANSDLTVQKNELSGFALAQGTSLTVVGSVNGDIVGNLDGTTQRLSVVAGAPGALTQNLLGVSVSRLAIEGGVDGRIITGGNLSNTIVTTSVERVTTASDGTYAYDWSGGAPGVGQALLNPFSPAAGAAGGNISAVSVGVLADNAALVAKGAVIAGGGGAGGVGGSINGLTVVSDPDGFLVQAGNGGDGPRGGKGGDVRNLLVNSVLDVNAQVDLIDVRAGHGGTALAAGQSGGAGGAVVGLSIGYNPVGRNLVETPLGDAVQISAGNGGIGDIGGAGGAITTVKVALDTNSLGPEFVAQAGDGGNGTRRDGSGGGITNLTARNFNLAGLNDDAIALSAGNGGSGGGGSGAGGAINQATIFASEVQLSGGTGSSGPVGGRGGGVSNVVLDVLPNFDWIRVLQINAGDGGSGVSGAGGAGGAIAGITAKSVNLLGLPSTIQSGDGGTSVTGRGGAAGGISGVKIAETLPDPAPATLNFISGNGGDGGAGGGAGGTLASLTFQGFATSALMRAGGGGDATILGSGGAGGGVSSAALQVLGGAPAQPGQILAGSGGDAAGSGGRGGVGGRITSATLIYAGDAQIIAGQGGSDGATGTSASAVGAGGSVSRAVLQALAGDAALRAGSAGTPVAAGVGAAGGAVASANVAALGNVLVQGGDGRAGGAGGAVSGISWFGVTAGQADAGAPPTGTVTVAGGQGSSGARSAGAGGSITNISGYASSTPAANTLIQAGDGNGGVAGARAAAGGSIGQVTLFGGAGVVEIIAGQGGGINPASVTPGTGGTGGSVSGVSVAGGLDIKTIAAGDGGNAALARGRGGLGGSVTSVNVDGDIGFRTGQNFGIDAMGGIFAGRGGSGDPASTTANGRSGNVQNVTAAAISCIVAGRPLSVAPFDFSMVNLVDRVFVRGSAAPTVQPNGSFDLVSAPGATPPRVGFADANIVGAVAGNPQDPGANIFKIQDLGVPADVPATKLQMRAAVGGGFEYNAELNPSNPPNWKQFLPIDGFVAARQITVGKNFVPQALMTLTNPLDPSSLQFSDYRNNFTTNA